MALNAKDAPSSGPSIDPLEAGTYPCRLVQVVDLGLQAQRPYLGKEKPPCEEILLTYEFVDEFLKDEDGEDIKEKPRWSSERMPLRNLEADKAKSTARYKALDPTDKFGGDFAKLVGTPCNVTMVQNISKGKIYSNVAAVSAMRAKDAEKCPPAVNDMTVFDLSAPDMHAFGALAKWVQKVIVENLNFNGSELQKKLAGKPVASKPKVEEPEVKADDDEIPY